MQVAVLIPAGGEPCEHRARAAAYVIEHYRTHHPRWDLIVGHTGQPWSKGAALADAYRQTSADMIVLADADSFVDPTILEHTVDQALDDGWAMPHWMVYRLDEQGTADVYAGLPPRPDRLVRGAYAGVKGGGIVAVRRDVYELVDGIDPRFQGWGGEDVSFARALIALHGKPARFAAELWHLWHPHPAPDLRGSEASEALVARYRDAANDPAAMRALIAERTTP